MTSADKIVLTVNSALQRAQSSAAASVFVAFDGPRMKRELEEARSRHLEDRALGPLDGCPIAIKANVNLAGRRTHAGSVAYHPTPAKQDAEIVQRLSRAGAVVLGHTNMSEFAFSGLGLNPHFGTPVNGMEHGKQLVPGGSSSGSASAVALGIADYSIGTDTSGSVRVPAAYQGLVGFRPSMNRYSVEGIFPLAPSLDVPGPITRTVSQAVLLDQILSGHLPAKPLNFSNLTFVVPSEISFGPVDEEVLQGVLATIEQLQICGARIVRREVEALMETRAAFAEYGTLVAAEARETLSQFVDLNDPRIDVRVRKRLESASGMTGDDVARLRSEKQRLEAKIKQELQGSLLLMPTTPMSPPSLHDVCGNDEVFAEVNARTLSLAMLGAFLNMPTVALPAVKNSRWISLSIGGAAGQDTMVLGAALTVESVLESKCQAD
ncbi:amidase family protein [Roseibium sp. SCP14]|uniref:amidase family protein n=1 Tax=Roseibium sp. SCP14 TaxID=3141375 RepID=UPI00333814DD